MAQEAQEVHLQLLLGRRVLGVSGRPIGRLEEVRAVPHGGDLRDLVVAEYLVGSYALLERLSASLVGRAVSSVFGAVVKRKGYRVPWDQMDLTDPEHPRLRCPVSELPRLGS